ncbi:MAG: ABC transporter ATP-binding protein [Alphaproteobacteria bacterium]|nr:ABC transporter ATP-binding protein [Alphaproteobacteria bacterium]
MQHVEIENVHKSFGSVEVIKGIDLSVAKGQFCALLGPSGCGKSTLLRMIAGLEAVSSGKVFVNGADVTNTHPAKRQIAMVFQSYALYPHMTVRQNISFSLDVAGRPKPEAAQRTEEVARILQLTDFLDRKPAQLSGGQRQRVAIGRALVRSPEVFLFDEPLSNLDAMLRVQMRFELAKLHEELATTMIYVTHDQIEAMTLASKIVVLDAGTISQVGTPLELYNQPANKFVAGFIGSPQMNFLKGRMETVAGREVRLELAGSGSVAILARGGVEDLKPGELEIGIRPEHIRPCNPGDAEANLSGRVELVEHLGNSTVLYVSTGSGRLVVQRSDDLSIRTGDTIGLAVDASRAHVFGADQRAI